MSLPKAPSDWFNKELNGQEIGRREQAGLPGREKTVGRSGVERHQLDSEEVGHNGTEK